ncbi:MAG: hypothetical protein B6D64_03490 [Bacteroidetes bacterium 4484_276]|nr:MAG: hypothetical protein B6D64_03490 [Bacteroidetes bacterium 4484_276]
MFENNKISLIFKNFVFRPDPIIDRAKPGRLPINFRFSNKGDSTFSDRPPKGQVNKCNSF